MTGITLHFDVGCLLENTFKKLLEPWGWQVFRRDRQYPEQGCKIQFEFRIALPRVITSIKDARVWDKKWWIDFTELLDLCIRGGRATEDKAYEIASHITLEVMEDFK